MIYGLITILVGLAIVAFMNDVQHKAHIARIQKQIDTLARLTGHDEVTSAYLSGEEKAMIIRLKSDGKSVEAIKKIRDITGLGLKDAKEYFDSL